MMISKHAGEILLFGCLLLGFIVAPFLLGKQGKTTTVPQSTKISADDKLAGGKKLETADFGAGCFWCVEAIFQQLDGVHSVESGYMGGRVKNPTYDQVCGGSTGHAEICRIKFDPSVISFKELLEVFWKTHDPTTMNRQGADSGTQYRSAVFYSSEEQKELAQKYKKRLNESGAFPNPVVTEISAASDFFPAGNYHADYYNKNRDGGYCRAVIDPKLDKFKRAFGDKLKTATDR